MNFDLYYPMKTKDGKIVPSVYPNSTEWSRILDLVIKADSTKKLVEAYRNGDKAAKPSLPAICFVGTCKGTRRASNMTPTQLVMIDVDHCEKPREAWNSIKQTIYDSLGRDWFQKNIMVVHVTPSGKGLHIIFAAQPELRTLKDNMDWLHGICDFNRYGDYDEVVKDFARLSFAFTYEDLLFMNVMLLVNTPVELPGILKNDVEDNVEAPKKSENQAILKVETFSDDEKKTFESLEFRGTPVRIIIEKYIHLHGEPSEGEKHNFYNELVKYFRCITSNNKRALLYLLPRFGHSEEECFSQIKSICRVNTLSTLPKPFYFFLKDNGFYKQELSPQQGVLKNYMLNDNDTKIDEIPPLPPVFRELVGLAPVDFVIPCINALLPIIGTLTSYIEAEYPYDGRMHTTSFFSIIYAPPGTGKGFIERYIDLLFEDIKIRDFVQSQRENVYLRLINKKGANERSPEYPQTSLRIIPPKNSEAEFLQKQRDNQGYHMFTYAAEMDSWAKGVKAAGGNKDDMIRIAWDNGEYGQQFKSANTFKGMVRLYWNVLISGTIQQIESYFKNVENGLVTRCSFTSIDNQEFKEAPRWKTLSAKKKEVIKKFMRRCDANTYSEPCNIVPDDLIGVKDEDFDNQINWRFKFKPKQIVDCSWIMPEIDAFHKEQLAKATLDVDHARDVFRRRVGVRGFRLAMICMCLWDRPTKQNLVLCKKFIAWWMRKDLESILNLWGAKYNEQADTTPNLVQRSVFTSLSDNFSTNDMYVVCMKQGIKTPIRRIVFDWKKLGFIKEVSKGNYIKIKK